MPLPDNYAESQAEGRADRYLDRRCKLIALAERYWIEVRETQDACTGVNEEDLWELLNHVQALQRWVSVTQVGGGADNQRFFLKTFGSREAAEDYALENFGDDMFAEFPKAICDLDAVVEPWGKLYVVQHVTVTYSNAPVMAQ